MLTLVDRLRDASRPVEILINNAGFGLGKDFLEAPATAHMQQVDVLAKVPLQLMYAALENMVARGRGRIINVASVAAFMPNGTYSAVKRFVVTMSESAHLQYSSAGISVTALCPGLTRSGFHRAMGVDEPQLPSIFWLSPDKVVAEAIQANFRNKAVVIPSITYKTLVFAQRLIPPMLTSLFPSELAYSRPEHEEPIYFALAAIMNRWEYIALNIVSGEITPVTA